MKFLQWPRRAYSLNPAYMHQQMSQWYANPARAKALDELQQLLAQWLSNCFGYYAVSVVSFSAAVDCLAAARTRFSLHLGPGGADAVAHFNALPIETESVDLIVALHTLEFVDDPHQVLREFDRVLIPNGCLIIIGFNPYGPQSLLKPIRLRRGVPWCGRFYSSWRLQEWFSVLGFAVKETHCCVLPGVKGMLPCSSAAWINMLPCLGDLVALKAYKQVSRLTPLSLSAEKSRVPLEDTVQQPTAFRRRFP